MSVAASTAGFGDPLGSECRYEKVSDVNRGAYGFVQKCLDKVTGEYVAVKFIRRQEMLSNAFLEREIINHCQLQHPFVIDFKDFFLASGFMVIVMELAEAGDLYDHVVNQNGLSEDVARSLFQQFIYGLHYCHENGIANRDVKPENTLLTETPEYGLTVKICDFGNSKNQVNGSHAKTKVGSPQYMAPEVIESTDVTAYDGKAADMWSCGVMLYVMVMSQYPFLRPGEKSNLRKIFKRMLEGTFPMKDGLSESLKDLIKGLLTVDTKKRLNMTQVMEHPWFVKDLPASLHAIKDNQLPTKRLISPKEVASVIASNEENPPPDPNKPPEAISQSPSCSCSCIPQCCTIC